MIAVTGATGAFGGLFIDALSERGVAAGDVRAIGRNGARLDELAARGLAVARADYDDLEAMEAAFAGADAVMFVSGSEIGRRREQHANVVYAARRAGVDRIVYTSHPHADTAPTPVAAEHRATETLLASSDIATTVLRNNWYTEGYRIVLPQARATHEVVTDWKDGLIASASRADFAEAAAIVLLGAGHEGRTYELSGDTAWSAGDLAAAVSEVLGEPVTHREVDPEDYATRLRSAGVPDAVVAVIGETDAWIATGGLADATPVLAGLLGRPTTSLVAGLRATT